jgi:hypothetical protein
VHPSRRRPCSRRGLNTDQFDGSVFRLVSAGAPPRTPGFQPGSLRERAPPGRSTSIFSHFQTVRRSRPAATLVWPCRGCHPRHVFSHGLPGDFRIRTAPSCNTSIPFRGKLLPCRGPFARSRSSSGPFPLECRSVVVAAP